MCRRMLMWRKFPKERLRNWDGNLEVAGCFVCCHVFGAIYTETQGQEEGKKTHLKEVHESFSVSDIVGTNWETELRDSKTLVLKPWRPGFAESTVFQLSATTHSLKGFREMVRDRKKWRYFIFVSVFSIYT